jgi:hypothetical protein
MRKVILPPEVRGDFVSGDLGWRSGSPLQLNSPNPDGFRGCLKKTGSYQDIASAISQILRNETQISRVARAMAPEQFPRRFDGRNRTGCPECLAGAEDEDSPASRTKGKNLRC